MPRRPLPSSLKLLLLAFAFGFAGCTTTLRSTLELSAAEVAAAEAFDLGRWAEVLSKRVDEEGLVDYVGLAAAPAALERFVAWLGAVGPTSRPALFPTRADRLAYYLNAYNALTLFNVLRRWPLGSVNDEPFEFFVSTCFLLDGKETSLLALENDLIRPQFKEPRVHFALNCASRGCPRLPREPFRPDTLKAQLRVEAERFLHDPRHVQGQGQSVLLSKIFEWYEEDFTPTPLAWIRAQAPDLDLPREPRSVEFRPYDWGLNRQ